MGGDKREEELGVGMDFSVFYHVISCSAHRTGKSERKFIASEMQKLPDFFFNYWQDRRTGKAKMWSHL